MRAGRAVGRHRREARSQPTINAGEIGEYGYCSRAWWYKHVARVPIPRNEGYGRLAAGTDAHRRHGGWVIVGARLRALGIWLALCGLLAMGLALWAISN